MPRLVLFSLLALGVVLPRLGPTQGSGGVTVTLLANEGVHLSSGTQQVLIDGLFRFYGPEFALPADSTRAQLEGARAPFDSVDLVLVTHRHGDHFHPVSMVSHLAANPRATLVTSRQVIDSMRGSLAAAPHVVAQTRAYTTAQGRRSRIVVNGIPLEVLGIPHGADRLRRVEHLGFVVDIGGRRVLHVGDTDGSEASFAPFRLDTARIDVALLPDWMVRSEDGRRVIAQWIKPKHVVAFHMPDDDAHRARTAQAGPPGVIPMSRSLERRTF